MSKKNIVRHGGAGGDAHGDAHGDAGRDRRSESVRESLRRHWRDLKKRPPAEREQFLKSTEGWVALGAKNCHDLLKEIARAKKVRAGQVCTSSWFEAWMHHGAEMPFSSENNVAEDHEHAARMLLSKEKNRGGDGQIDPESVTPTRRWTPPQAVNVEDAMDGMSHIEAAFYQHPRSPSAQSILGIRLKRGREEPLRYGRSKAIKAQKKRDEERSDRRAEQDKRREIRER